MIKRDPSIHVKRSDLIQLLSNTPGIEITGSIDRVVELLFMSAKLYAIPNRSYVEVKKTSQKKASNALSVTSKQAEVFNGLLTSIRTERHHKGIKVITESDAQYTTLLSATKLALEFANAFYSKEEERIGIKDYITIGLDLMKGSYSLSKFVSYSESIFRTGDKCLLLQEDTNKEGTADFIEAYKKLVMSATQIQYLVESVDKQVDFLLGRIEADKHKASYKNWIEAQFSELAFMNTIPNPSQLHGENALFRYQKYVVKLRSEGKLKAPVEKTPDPRKLVVRKTEL